MSENDILIFKENLNLKFIRLKKILLKIREIEMDDNFIDEELLEIFQLKIDYELSKSFSYDLVCVVCKNLPDGNVFSCSNDHLICQSCFNATKVCFNCNESFVLTPPRRNFLAERQILLIRKYHQIFGYSFSDRNSTGSLLSYQIDTILAG